MTKTEIDKSIDEIIRPDAEKFVEVTDKTLDDLKVLFRQIAVEKDDFKIKKLSGQIQGMALNLCGLAAYHEKKTGRDKISIFLDTLLLRTPQSQSNRRIALSNAKDLSENLLSGFLHDVDVRGRLIEELKKWLKRASLSEKNSKEVMDEVYGKTKELSDKMLEIVLESNHIDKFRAEIGVGYFALLPGTTEEEVVIVTQKLLSVSSTYLTIAKKYREQKMEDKFHIRPGDQLLGVRKKGFQENFFLAKVIALEEGEITCMVSLDPFKPGERMEFSSKTGELLGDADYSLLKKLNFAEAVNSRTNKPPEGRVEGYSVYVVAKWKAGENKEKVGVGYYDIHNKRWLMPGEKDGGATGVLDSSVISWIRVPEILEVMEKI